MGNKQTDIVIYRPKGKAPTLEVRLEEDTVWLTQVQMAELFHRTKQNISLHINNIYRERELDRKSTVKEYLTVQTEGDREVQRNLEYYNLDVIISVGYRVKSKIGTHLRIWATNILREYTVKGYALNRRRLREAQERLDELTRSIRLIRTVAETRKLSQDETRGLLQVISDYAYGLKTLDAFDWRELAIDRTREEVTFVLDYDTARKSIDEMAQQIKKSQEAVGLFGVESGDALKGSLKAIYQTVSGKGSTPALLCH